MRKTLWITAFLLAGSLGISSAMSADVAKQAPASETGKLESISGVPADMKHDHDKCPMHEGHKSKDKCDHKKGEPCPYHDKGHHDKKHHDHANEKCDHDQHK